MQQDNPKEKIVQLISEAESAGGVLTLNWHQRVFNDHEFADRRDLYIYAIEECKRRGAWIVPLGDIHQHWLKNHPQI